MKKVDISFESLYRFIKEKQDCKVTGLFVKSERGEFTPINDILQKKDRLCQFIVDGSYLLQVGYGHIFKAHDGGSVKAYEIEDELLVRKGEGSFKKQPLMKLQRINKDEHFITTVYDINIPYPHWYQLSETMPIVSHNTFYLANYAAMAARKGYNVAIFTMEDGTKKWAGRIDQNLMQITKEEMRVKGLSLTNTFKSVIRDSFGRIKLQDLPTGLGNVDMMREALEEWEAEDGFRPHLIISDYLGIMKPVSDYKNSYEKGKFIAEEFRALAQEYECAAVSAQQFNREASSKKRPGTENTQDSIGIPQTADAIVGIVELQDEANNKHIMMPLKSRSVDKRKIKDTIVKIDTDRQTVLSTEKAKNIDKETRSELQSMIQKKDERKKKVQIKSDKQKKDEDDLSSFLENL